MLRSVKKLSEKEFKKTMIPPMQSISIEDESSGVNLKRYVTKILNKEKLQTTIESIEITFIYQSSDKAYEHVLFDYGHNETYLVIII